LRPIVETNGRRWEKSTVAFDDNVVTSVITGWGVVMARFAGEIDLANCGQLRDALDGPPGRVLLVDLGAVTFMDGAGIRELLRQRDGAVCLRVVHTSPAVERLLRLTGLYAEFCRPEPD
jgi:anti-anti-sigma factor